MKVIVLVLLFLFSVTTVEAKVLPQAKKATGGVVKNTSTIGVSPKIRADRKAVVIYFSNLANARSVSYMLVYKQNGQEEGAMGGLNLGKNNSQSAELLFGTCSKNVCRYHYNITDARLEVSYTSTNGKKYLKKYRLKV